MAARGRTLIREQDRAAWVAWHVAALMRTDKLPKLETMMSKTAKHKAKPMTIEEQWTVMSAVGKAH